MRGNLKSLGSEFISSLSEENKSKMDKYVKGIQAVRESDLKGFDERTISELKENGFGSITKREEIDLLHDQERIPEARLFFDKGIHDGTSIPNPSGEEIVFYDKLLKQMNNMPDDWDNENDFEPYILTAKEALLKSKEVHLRAIEDFILKAVEQGETSCEILPTQQYVSKENIDVLTQAGYTVINQQTKMGNEIKISWDERH